MSGPIIAVNKPGSGLQISGPQVAAPHGQKSRSSITIGKKRPFPLLGIDDEPIATRGASCL